MAVCSRAHDQFKSETLTIDLHLRGEDAHTKLSYPVKYGIFSRLETPDFIFEFNLNHEIRHARSKSRDWLHPSEWLKRTIGNDWIYYSSGGYAGVFEALGEYYLPNFTYRTNSLLGGKPFEEKEIKKIKDNWYKMILQFSNRKMPKVFETWFEKVMANTPQKLHEKARHLFEINGTRLAVMPPDARHVDYNLIPVNIADGCLYKCRFCKVKNKKPFTVRTSSDIDRQLEELVLLFDKDIYNYNALFIGEHDALAAPSEVICQTVMKAYDRFDFKSSYMKKNMLFAFASADSLLSADGNLFDRLGALPFKTFINIGLESCDQETLNLLGKPINVRMVKAAFDKIQKINKRYRNIELTCNFLMDEDLPQSHYHSVMSLIRDSLSHTQSKGTVYFSPLRFGQPSRKDLYDFYRLKSLSRLPTFLYLIQRL